MINAAQSGRFRIGAAFDVNRLGFGAMRVIGREDLWGPPADRAEALRTLRRLPISAPTSSTPPIPMAPTFPRS